MITRFTSLSVATLLACAISPLFAQSGPAYYYKGKQRIDVELVPAASPALLRGMSTRPSVALHPAQAKDSSGDKFPTGRIAFQVPIGESPAGLAARYNLTELQPVPYAENTYTATVPIDPKNPLSDLTIANTLQERRDTTWATPLLATQQQVRFVPNDTLFPNQWHLRNTGSNVTGGSAGNDLNVVPAWDFATGLGVNIAISDEGVETTHPDLLANARTDIDHDFNSNDDDPWPLPSQYHGTGCAGVAAGVGNNGLGITGSAFQAGIVGLRLISLPTTDQQEADAMNWQAAESNPANQVHVHSSSWGPTDNGQTLEAPGPLTRAALESGATFGRNGKGIVYVWAAGNGRQNADNVNRDGYANNPNVIAISATNSAGTISAYSEPGAAILVNAPSSQSGSNTIDRITTTDNQGSAGGSASDYYTLFGGTSSAAPAAAGVIALMLQANPALTYRDVMHILVDTATRNDPANAGWRQNGSGRYYSHDYGFGRINAAAAVTSSAAWQNLPARRPDVVQQASIPSPLSIPDNNTTGISISIPVNASPTFTAEHVELEADIAHTYRGDLRITITSPSGMVSQLFTSGFDSADNLSFWPMRSVAHWGENPTGTWTVNVADVAQTDLGVINSLKLTIRGYDTAAPASADSWQLYE